MINAFHFSCEGESHKATNKVCQDYSLTSIKDGLAVAVVCDGHGGERYFRSDIGAKYAAEITLDVVSLFVENIDQNIFVNIPYTAIGPTSTIDDAEQLSEIDKAFRRLFSSIIYKWNEKIDVHAKTTALSDWELKNVPQKYRDEFAEAKSLEKLYGCTLMAYVQTDKYWFAFHIGDGKCISFQNDPIWKEPIPWDERCFLNKTTSLCDASAIEEFRYCYQGNGEFPIAVFLGSDGLDDSFGEDENLVNFYIQIMKMLEKDGIEATSKSIQEDLPQLSAIGSKDDMSIAFVYDTKYLSAHVTKLIQYQLQLVTDSIHQVDEKAKSLSEKLVSLKDVSDKDEKTKIEATYAKQDLERANENRQKLLLRFDSLEQQLSLNITSNLNEEINGEN